MRIGHGYDVHRCCDGDTVVLGGVSIEHSHGLEAHSDGDVLIHAICDAMLGALGAGDIGKHFPDTDAGNADIDSRILLRRVVTVMTDGGYKLGNLDATIVAQAPRMSEHTTAMCMNIAADIQADVGQINVKATTTEKLGFTGRGEGIAAHAVVLLLPLQA